MNLDQIFQKVALASGKRPEDLAAFKQKLQENWLQTEQAIRNISESQWKSLGFPLGLVKCMQKVLSKTQQTSQPAQKQQKKEQQKEGLNFQQVIILAQNIWMELRQQIFNKYKIMESLSTINRVLLNVVNDPTNLKFHTLRSANQTLADKVFAYRTTCQLLLLAGFQQTKQGLSISNLNLALLNQVLKKTSQFFRRAQDMFDPYKQHYGASGGNSIVQKLNRIDHFSETVDYGKLSEQLIMQRRKLMSHQPHDRNIKIYKGSSSLLNKFQESSRQEYNQEQYQALLQNDPLLLKQVLKSLKSKDQKFSNRRKRQFDMLVKEEVFKITTIRIKMPDDYIIQADFGPLQTVQKLIQLLAEMLLDGLQFYLFNPYLKIKITTPQQMAKSFYELQAVPNFVFMLGVAEEVAKDKLLLNQKTLLMLAKKG